MDFKGRHGISANSITSPTRDEHSIVYTAKGNTTCSLRMKVGRDSASFTLTDGIGISGGTRVDVRISTQTQGGCRKILTPRIDHQRMSQVITFGMAGISIYSYGNDSDDDSNDDCDLNRRYGCLILRSEKLRGDIQENLFLTHFLLRRSPNLGLGGPLVTAQIQCDKSRIGLGIKIKGPIEFPTNLIPLVAPSPGPSLPDLSTFLDAVAAIPVANPVQLLPAGGQYTNGLVNSAGGRTQGDYNNSINIVNNHHNYFGKHDDNNLSEKGNLVNNNQSTGTNKHSDLDRVEDNSSGEGSQRSTPVVVGNYQGLPINNGIYNHSYPDNGIYSYPAVYIYPCQAPRRKWYSLF